MQKFECIDIKKSVSGKEILKGISVEVCPGEVIALLGPNGAGKTTSFSILCGLIKPDSGKVMLNGHDITKYPMYRRARMGIGYLPQEPSVFRGLTAKENILAVLESRKCSNKEERLSQLLKDFAIEHVGNTRAVLLSGGERRKLEIARALANDPQYIMLDEPLAGIDPIAIAEMRDVIIGLKSRDIGVIVTDHNIMDTLPIVDHVYIINEGRVLAHGTSNEILKNEDVISKYIGKSLAAKL